MLIQYRANGVQREIKDSIAEALIARRVAIAVPTGVKKQITKSPQTKVIVAKPAPLPKKKKGKSKGKKAPSSVASTKQEYETKAIQSGNGFSE